VVEVPPSNVGRPLPPPPVSQTEPSSSRARPLPTAPDAVNTKGKQEVDLETQDTDKQQQTSSDQNKPSAPIRAWEEGSQSSMFIYVQDKKFSGFENILLVYVPEE
jgi:hypothetical protein